MTDTETRYGTLTLTDEAEAREFLQLDLSPEEQDEWTAQRCDVPRELEHTVIVSGYTVEASVDEPVRVDIEYRYLVPTQKPQLW